MSGFRAFGKSPAGRSAPETAAVTPFLAFLAAFSLRGSSAVRFREIRLGHYTGLRPADMIQCLLVLQSLAVVKAAKSIGPPNAMSGGQRLPFCYATAMNSSSRWRLSTN